MAIRLLALWGHRDLFFHGPHTSSEFTSHSDDDLVRLFASCNQAARAFAQPYLCLPADVLDGLGLLCESQLQMATDFCGIAIRSRPFDERSTGMGITGFGQGTLPAPLPAGVF
jgi:hypothetical protein